MAVQLSLHMRRQSDVVDMKVIADLPSINAACAKCAEWSGLSDKVICIETDMDPGQWSRIKSGQAHPSSDFLLKLMDVCGNEVPLVWLIHQRGYDPHSLRRRENELERDLRMEREKTAKLEDELTTIKKFMKEIGRP